MFFLLFIWLAVSIAIIIDDYVSFKDLKLSDAVLAFAWPFCLWYLFRRQKK